MIFCSTFLKNAIGILIGTALDLYIALGNRAILPMLVLPVREQGMSLHFFAFSSLTFNNVLLFLM